MNNQMIEKIARIIAPDWFTDDGSPPIINNYPSQHKYYQEKARSKARAIEAAYNPDNRLIEAATDALAGWRYIRQHHGDLYGIGWDRVEQQLMSALNPNNEGD